MISVDALTVEFGGTTLFSDISFVVNDKDRIALMGKNGAGKSTLLKIISGVKSASKGPNLGAKGGCHSLLAATPADGRQPDRIR